MIGMVSRAEEARARATCYELLALALSPPSVEMAAAIRKGEAPFSLPAFDQEALGPEYHRLFVGPGPLPAPPYESVYREGRLFGETTVEVRRRCQEAGYALDPSVAAPPDHVTAELTFMALLAEEEANAWEGEDAIAALAWLERERRFLRDHLTRWLPAFCDRILGFAESPFYRRLAAALREFVALDLERVEALTGLLEEVLA